MIIFLGIIQLIFIFGICLYELKNKSTIVFLWAVLLVMFGIPHLTSILGHNYSYSIDTINVASFFVILFCFVYIITRSLLDYKLLTNKKNKNILNKKSLIKFTFFLFIIFLFIVFYRIFNIVELSGGIGNSSWETMRNASSKCTIFNSFFTPFYFISSSCLLFALIMKKKLFVIAICSVIIINVLISRNRIEILPIFVALIYTFIMKKDKISFKNILLLGLMGVLGIYCVYALRAYRHIGTIDNLVNNYNVFTFNQKVLEYFRENDGEMSLKDYFYYYIENDNNFENFGKGHTYIRMILFGIPTKYSFGLKPPDFAISMGSAILPGSTGYSMHPTLFGDAYANFGLWGFLLGIFWAFYGYFVDLIISKSNNIISIASSMIFSVSYIIEARGSVYNGFFWGTYGFIFLLVFYFIFCLWEKFYEKKVK